MKRHIDRLLRRRGAMLAMLTITGLCLAGSEREVAAAPGLQVLRLPILLLGLAWLVAALWVILTTPPHKL